MSDAGGANAVEDLRIDIDDEFDQSDTRRRPVGRHRTRVRADRPRRRRGRLPAPLRHPTPRHSLPSTAAPPPGTGACTSWTTPTTSRARSCGGGSRSQLASTAYPSELQVSGIGPVTDVDVSILGFDTKYGLGHRLPAGRSARTAGTVLLDDAGGGSNEAVTGKNLRFDDEAPFQAPEDDPLESTSYQPTSYEDDPVFPPPAPAPPGPQGPPTSLGVFDGTDPNGTWRLFGFDESRRGLHHDPRLVAAHPVGRRRRSHRHRRGGGRRRPDARPVGRARPDGDRPRTWYRCHGDAAEQRRRVVRIVDAVRRHDPVAARRTATG